MGYWVPHQLPLSERWDAMSAAPALPPTLSGRWDAMGAALALTPTPHCLGNGILQVSHWPNPHITPSGKWDAVGTAPALHPHTAGEVRLLLFWQGLR